MASICGLGLCYHWPQDSWDQDEAAWHSSEGDIVWGHQDQGRITKGKVRGIDYSPVDNPSSGTIRVQILGSEMCTTKSCRWTGRTAIDLNAELAWSDDLQAGHVHESIYIWTCSHLKGKGGRVGALSYLLQIKRGHTKSGINLRREVQQGKLPPLNCLTSTPHPPPS